MFTCECMALQTIDKREDNGENAARCSTADDEPFGTEKRYQTRQQWAGQEHRDCTSGEQQTNSTATDTVGSSLARKKRTSLYTQVKHSRFRWEIAIIIDLWDIEKK